MQKYLYQLSNGDHILDSCPDLHHFHKGVHRIGKIEDIILGLDEVREANYKLVGELENCRKNYGDLRSQFETLANSSGV